MTIAISGNGTITGISANGLPSGIITSTQIATGAITATQIAANTITGTQIAANTVGVSQITSGLSLSSLGWWGTGYATKTQLSFGGNRYIFLWQHTPGTDGRYFYGMVSWTNYDAPSSYHLHIHNGYPQTTGNVASFGYAQGSVFGTTGTLQVQRVTYSGASYIALYNSGATNREFYFHGINNGWDGVTFPMVVGSVSSTDATYLSI